MSGRLCTNPIALWRWETRGCWSHHAAVGGGARWRTVLRLRRRPHRATARGAGWLIARTARRRWVCRRVECRYHLGDMGPAVQPPGCALILAVMGAMTNPEIAEAIGVSRQAVDQATARAEERIRRLPVLQQLADGSAALPTVDERVEAALRRLGDTTAWDVANVVGLSPSQVRVWLGRLVEDGRVVLVRRNRRDGNVWRAA